MSALEKFLATDTTIREGSDEWKAIVNAKVDDLDVPGVIMQFTMDEVREAGLVYDPAFEGCDVEEEAEDAMTLLALARMSVQERRERYKRNQLARLPDPEADDDAGLS
jgi:hypothetical protein